MSKKNLVAFAAFMLSLCGVVCMTVYLMSGMPILALAAVFAFTWAVCCVGYIVESGEEDAL